MVGRLDGTLDRTPVAVEADGRTVTIRLPKMIGAARALLRLRKIAPSRGGFRLPRDVDVPEVRIKAGRLPSFRAM